MTTLDKPCLSQDVVMIDSLDGLVRFKESLAHFDFKCVENRVKPEPNPEPKPMSGKMQALLNRFKP